MNNVGDLISEYRNEVHVVISSFYAWKSLNDIPAIDNSILEKLNKNAVSWNLIRHSLQITFFTTLGRIFDNDRRSLTVHSFINKCKNEIGQFKKSSLESRRIQGAGGHRPDYLDNYLLSVYEPTEQDFEKIKIVADKYKKIYEDNYEPIRNKIIAHKDLKTLEIKDSLYANTNIGEIEELLNFLCQVREVISAWYLDGRNTNLSDYALTNNQHFIEDRKDLENLLQRISL